MSEQYEPELGQMLFGQPCGDKKVSWELECAIDALAHAFSAIHKKDSPFSNTGARYAWPSFRVHAYSWNDDEHQQFNFMCKDVRVSWYKHSKRGLSCNICPNGDELRQMLTQCMRDMLMEEPREDY